MEILIPVKILKIFFIIFALFGTGLLIPGAVLAWWSASAYLQAPEFAWSSSGIYFEWTGFGYVGGFAACLIGMILTLIGGLRTKMPYLWIGLILAALVYCVPFVIGSIFVYQKELQYPMRYSNPTEALGTLGYLFPGIIILIEGITLINLKDNNNKEQSS